MPKPRLAIILPILMVCAAFPAARWQRRVDVQFHNGEYPFISKVTSLYQGINAPAVLFETLCVTVLPIYRLNHPPPSFFGIGAGQLLFFSGVVVLWFIVGLIFDRRRDRQTHSRAKATIWQFVWNLMLLAFAILLFGAAVFLIIGRQRTNPLGDLLQGLLCLGWSLLFAVGSGLKLLKVFQRT